MSQVAFSLQVNFQSMTCGECGIDFAAPADFWHERRRDHKTWCCPNGHQRHYPGESNIEAANRLLREEKERHARTLARENAERAEREKLARKLKRVGRGVCPECNRSFVDLARHMNCKHAEKAK